MNVAREIKQESNLSMVKFPEVIDFITASNCISSMGNLDCEGKILFDLSETVSVHSSFIGFLIDVKRKIDHRGGRLSLDLSPFLEKQLNEINLYTHFQP